MAFGSMGEFVRNQPGDLAGFSEEAVVLGDGLSGLGQDEEIITLPETGKSDVIVLERHVIWGVAGLLLGILLHNLLSKE